MKARVVCAWPVLLMLVALVCAPFARAGQPTEDEPTAPDLRKMWANVHEQVKDSVFLVDITLPGSTNHVFGTGFLVTKTGYALTNDHVIAPPGERRAIFLDGSARRYDVIVGNHDRDLALIKVHVGEDATPLALGRSGRVRVGDPVIVMGNPNGGGMKTSHGIIDAIGINSHWGGPLSGKMLETDALISGGNSGGPVINDSAQAIGIISSVLVGAHRISFAIPTDLACTFLPEMLWNARYLHFATGMTIPADGLGEVTDVDAGSSAGVAGIEAGDVIMKIDGQPVARGVDVSFALIGHEVGDAIAVELRRGAEQIETTFRLMPVPVAPAQQPERTAPGLAFEYYEGDWDWLPTFDELEPAATGVADTIDVERYAGKDHFALRLTGFIRVPVDGMYIFHLGSDDGSWLTIGDKLVVNNNGLHDVVLKEGFVDLAAGLHPITVTYFEKTGGEGLVLNYSGPGVAWQAVPKSALFHVPPGEADPVEPGEADIVE